MSTITGSFDTYGGVIVASETQAGKTLHDVVEESDTVYLTFHEVVVANPDAALPEDQERTIELEKDVVLECERNEHQLQLEQISGRNAYAQYKDKVGIDIDDHDLMLDGFEARVEKIEKATGETVHIADDGSVGAHDADSERGSTGDEPDANSCPECGTTLGGDESFCPECGHALSN